MRPYIDSIAALAGIAKVSQGTAVPNDLHTWLVDGNETPPLHSGIPRCCPLPYHLNGHAFCHRAMIAPSGVCYADTITSPSTILFGFPHLPHRSCARRVLCWHISTQYLRPLGEARRLNL